MGKLKMTAVSYLNTKPLLYGLMQSGMDKEIDLQLNIPSECAKKLESGEVDLGLVPVALIPSLKTPYIISDYCIACDGPVNTVAIFGEVPIEEMTTIYLDFHSRTSVALTKVLVENHWNTKAKLVNAEEGYIQNIKGTVGGLVIGDRAMGLEKNYKFTYDLGEEWKRFTGLPFVFAAWISNKPLGKDFIARFNSALQLGINSIPQLIFLLPTPENDYDLAHYFEHYIHYELNSDKRKGLHKFLGYISEHIQPSLKEGLALV